MKTIYLCGPILGLSYDQCVLGWRYGVAGNHRVKELVEDGELALLDPLRGITREQYESQDEYSVRQQFRRDRSDVKSCDLLLACFLDAPVLKLANGKSLPKPSTGSAVEIGWADAWGKPIVVASSQDHPHPFYTETAIVVERELDAAIDSALQVLGLLR